MIAELLQQAQENFEWNYDFRIMGASAFASSYDTWHSKEFMVQIKDHCQPNGYIYGVGCDTVTCLLQLFSKEPLGMILIDIDPAVVAYTKIFVQALARFESVTDFFLECCGPRNRAFYECLEETILTLEENSVVKEQMLQHRARVKKEWVKNLTFCHESSLAPYWMKEGYFTLHKLAKEGNIAVLHGDFFDPKLLSFLSELPSWKESKNVVYMANASDHIHRNVSLKYPKESFVEALNSQIVSRLENLKGQNYFIDTTQSNHYQLRLRTTIPYFSEKDF